MKNGIVGKIVLLAAIVACGLVLNHSHGYLSRTQAADAGKEGDLYLPETPYLKFISLGHDGLVADLVLAKALTYYGSHYYERRSFAFKHLKKLFKTAVEMDPHNKDAFLMANNILSGVDIKASIEILELGMFYHPAYWKFPEMIGFDYFYHLRDPHSAARYYEIAARLPGHPPYVPSLSGKFYQESGRYEDAIRVLYNFYNTTEDKRLKESFKESIEAVKERIRQKQFRLQATVEEVLDAYTFRFRRATDNPQFKFLEPVETLRIVGLNPFDIHSADETERLFAFMQQEYTRLVLTGSDVSIQFERHPDGRIKQDSQGRLLGSAYLKSQRLFKVEAISRGFIKPYYKFPYNNQFRELVKKAEKDAIEKKKGWYGFPPEMIPLKELHRRVGGIVSIEFEVYRVDVERQTEKKAEKETEKEYVYLRPSTGYKNLFSVVIPTAMVSRIPLPSKITDIKELAGQRVKVTGLVGLRDKKIELKIYTPSQLEVQ